MTLSIPVLSRCNKCGGKSTGPHQQGCTPGARFWARVALADSGCWEWQGAASGFGYGDFRVSTRVGYRAHQYAWEWFNGPITPGMFVMHSCDNPKCVNPAHLKLGTPKDNNQDMWSKGRGRPYVRPPRTHCRNGHELDEENTYLKPQYDGKKGFTRECRACRRKPGGKPRLAGRGRRG